MKSLRWFCLELSWKFYFFFLNNFFAEHEDDQVQGDQNWCSDETQVNILKGSNGNIKNIFFFLLLIPKNTYFVAPLEKNYTNNNDQFICKKKYTNYDITRQSLNCCPTFIVLKFFIWIYIRWRLLY